MAGSKSLTIDEKKYKKAIKEVANAEKDLKALTKDTDKLLAELAKIEKMKKKRK